MGAEQPARSNQAIPGFQRMQEFDLDHFQKSVAEYVSGSLYAEAMLHIKSFVEQIINEPESVGVVFASREVDALCEQLADAYYSQREAQPAHAVGGTVILASELVKAGGHVELMKDYLALELFESPVRVALTNVFNRFDHATIAEWESLLNCEVYVAPHLELDGKLDALTARLEEWRPSTIVAMGHNQDVVCVVAAHAPGVTSRFYVHHGDHHLSLGVTCPAFEHVDLHNVGYELCKTQIGVERQLFWPISTVRPGEVKTRFLERGALTSCSCGRMSKFESDSYTVRYERAVALILKTSGGYHVHIGELSDAFLAKIYDELDAENVSRDRFIYIEWVPSLSKALIEQSVDVYVTSFPLGGGKSSIEAMSVGVPVIVHESYRSRNHGGGDLVYPSSHGWSGYDELCRIFAQWDELSLREHAAAALRHFERYYSKEALMTAFASGRNCADCVPPLRPYRRNALRAYLDARRARVRANERAEAESTRVFQEWQRVNAAYEAHSATVLSQREQIEQLLAEKAALEVSLAECESKRASRTWKNKITKLLGK